MLIGAQKRFIFIANVKCASTSIEAALARYSDVILDQTDLGKHISVPDIDMQYAGLFSVIARHKFRVVAVLREPLDWLKSLYRSHKAELFRGTELSTEDMSFGEFLGSWVKNNREQCLPQTFRLVTHDSFAADFIMDYRYLQSDYEYLCKILNIPASSLQKLNTSERIDTEVEVSQGDIDSIYEDYKQDVQVLRGYSRRLLSPREKSEAYALCRQQIESHSTQYYQVEWPLAPG